MTFRIGGRAEAWNDIASQGKDTFYAVRREFYNTLFCDLLGRTSPSAFRVLAGATARTFRWNKYAEAISATQFCRGLSDPHSDDGLHRLDDGDLTFRGCNIAKEDTVRNAIAELEEASLISKWKAPRTGWRNTYMPCSELWLAQASVRNGGLIPVDLEYWVDGELLICPEGHLRLDQTLDDGRLHCNFVDKQYHPTSRAKVFDADEVHRLTPTQFEELRGDDRAFAPFR